MKVILLRELYDEPGDMDSHPSLCDFTRSLNNVYLSRLGYSPLRDYLRDHGIQRFGGMFLTLQLKYREPKNETTKAITELFDTATSIDDYEAARAVECVVRRMGGTMRDNTEVTGCRFALQPEYMFDRVPDELQKLTQEYFSSIGFPAIATTTEQVVTFISRLREDLAEVDKIVKIVEDE